MLSPADAESIFFSHLGNSHHCHFKIKTSKLCHYFIGKPCLFLKNILKTPSLSLPRFGSLFSRFPQPKLGCFHKSNYHSKDKVLSPLRIVKGKQSKTTCTTRLENCSQNPDPTRLARGGIPGIGSPRGPALKGAPPQLVRGQSSHHL